MTFNGQRPVTPINEAINQHHLTSPLHNTHISPQDHLISVIEYILPYLHKSRYHDLFHGTIASNDVHIMPLVRIESIDAFKNLRGLNHAMYSMMKHPNVSLYYPLTLPENIPEDIHPDDYTFISKAMAPDKLPYRYLSKLMGCHLCIPILTSSPAISTLMNYSTQLKILSLYTISPSRDIIDLTTLSLIQLQVKGPEYVLLPPDSLQRLSIDDGILNAIDLTRLRNLRSLHLHCARRNSTQYDLSLLPMLEELNLTLLADLSILKCDGVTKLRRLILTHCVLEESSSTLLGVMTLEELQMSSCIVNNVSFSLANRKALKTLHISNTTITVVSLPSNHRPPQLRSLHIRKSLSLAQLEWLLSGPCPLHSLSMSTDLSLHLDLLPSTYNQLRHLSIETNNQTTMDLYPLTQLSSLSIIDLGGEQKVRLLGINDTTLPLYRTIRSLTLCVGSKYSHYNMLVALSNGLEALELQSSSFDHYPDLSHLRHLKHLNIEGCTFNVPTCCHKDIGAMLPPNPLRILQLCSSRFPTTDYLDALILRNTEMTSVRIIDVSTNADTVNITRLA